MKHEIGLRRKNIEKLRESLSRTSVERVFDVKVNPDDLVSVAENLIHFIQLILDIHNKDESVRFTDDLYYDHELVTAVDSLERAAENKPNVHRFAEVVKNLQALIQNFENVEHKKPDPASKTQGDPAAAKDLFRIEANRIPKRLDDLVTRSKDLLRDPSPQGLSASASAGSRTTPLENPISTLVNLYISHDLNKAYTDFGGKTYAVSGTNLEGYAFSIRSNITVTEALALKRASQLFDLFTQIEASNNCPRQDVSSLRASKEAVLLDLGDRLISPLKNKLSPDVIAFLGETPVFKDRTDQEVDDLLTDWIEQWVDEIYPLTLHNIHECLRDLDQKLSKLAQTDVFQRPAFERLKERRPSAVVKVPPGGNGKLVEIEFRPFQAEEGADYELVLGLSRPLNDFEKLRSNVEENPEIRLYVNDKLVERPYLRLEPDFSSDTMLVFRIPKPSLRAGLLGQGLYTPRLLIKRDYLPLVGGDGKIGYTFTVGTRRPNVQIIASLRQPQPKEAGRDPAKDPEFAFRGVIAANQFDAIVEAEVFAGAPVLKANVSSVLQRVDNTNLAIDTPNYELRDDGVYPDLLKDDGIYTARITLQPAARRKAAEYRVFIEARSNGKEKFYPLVDPVINAGADKSTKEKEPPPVPPFQRSTSLNFHAAQES